MKRLLMLASALLLACQAWGGATLEAVKRRGYVQCGISEGLPGFSQPDEGGSYRGLDVDFCRAVAAALFGDAARVRYIPLTSRERFTALQSGEVDLLSRNTTWTSSRDSAMGLHFAGIIYYDGQGFMVPRDKSLERIEQLDGARICLQPGTTTALNLADYFTSHNLKFTPVFHERSEASALAFQRGECDALTSDQSQLYAQRLRLDRPDRYRVLPTIISKEPLGPVVRHGDDEWFDVIKWTLYAMINGEELGVDSSNVDQLHRTATEPAIRRLLGLEGEKGRDLGLPRDWAYQIIRQVGNYGQVFERNVGRASPLGIERGLNALWNQGGLQYAPPIR